MNVQVFPSTERANLKSSFGQTGLDTSNHRWNFIRIDYGRVFNQDNWSKKKETLQSFPLFSEKVALLFEILYSLGSDNSLQILLLIRMSIGAQIIARDNLIIKPNSSSLSLPPSDFAWAWFWRKLALMHCWILLRLGPKIFNK